MLDIVSVILQLLTLLVNLASLMLYINTQKNSRHYLG